MSAAKKITSQIAFLAVGVSIGFVVFGLREKTPPTPPAATPVKSVSDSVATSDDPREPAAVLSEAIQTSDRDSRLVRLRELAARMAARDVSAAIALGKKIPDANDRLEFLRTVFAAWAEREPLAALDYAKANFPPGILHSELVSAVIEKWAALEPRAVREWIEKNLSGPLKEQGLAVAVAGWVRNDPLAAAAWFLSTGSTSQTVLNSLVTAWADLDPKSAAQWVESLADPQNKAAARVSLAAEWASQNSAVAAAHFARHFSAPGGQDIAATIANAWAVNDPAAAAAWVGGLPPGSLRASAAATVATVWAASDIAAATKWSATIEDSQMRAAVIDHLGTTWGAIEPLKALDWLRTLPEGDARRDATTGALHSWAATDAPGLAGWLATAPVGFENDTARAGLGAVLMEKVPADAMKTVLGIGDVTMRGDEAAKLFLDWRKRDEPAAQRWLQATWPQLAPGVQERLARVQKRPLSGP